MNGVSLDDLRARLAALDEAPVHVHPDVLDEVHRAIVAELDDLSELRVDGASPARRS